MTTPAKVLDLVLSATRLETALDYLRSEGVYVAFEAESDGNAWVDLGEGDSAVCVDVEPEDDLLEAIQSATSIWCDRIEREQFGRDVAATDAEFAAQYRSGLLRGH